MNLPNKLTVLRVVLVPAFVVAMLLSKDASWLSYLALGIFIVASLTDFADGYIARKYNMITNFGKLMDPLADKLLVCSALICLVALGRLEAWVAIVIISREFIISGFRLLAVEQGVVIAASMWGKAKTVSQIAMIIILLIHHPSLQILEYIAVIIAVLLTVISLVDYIAKNAKFISDK